MPRKRQRKNFVDDKNMGKIELVIFDIDGVITDGSMTIDSKGNELKNG